MSDPRSRRASVIRHQVLVLLEGGPTTCPDLTSAMRYVFPHPPSQQEVAHALRSLGRVGVVAYRGGAWVLR